MSDTKKILRPYLVMFCLIVGNRITEDGQFKVLQDLCKGDGESVTLGLKLITDKIDEIYEEVQTLNIHTDEPKFPMFRFSGSGDSGEFEEYDGVSIPYKVEEDITIILENSKELSVYDWWNNDGGIVRILFNVLDFTIEYDFDIKVVDWLEEKVRI